MSTTVRVNAAVQFTFFVIMGLNITIITSCDSLIVILVTYIFIIKTELWTEKPVRNVARIKSGLRCVYVICSVYYYNVTPDHSS